MKYLLAILFVTCFLYAPAKILAQDDPFVVTEPTTPAAHGHVDQKAQCFNVMNTAPYTVYGVIQSNSFTREDGITTRHRANFRLEKEQQAEFCTTGPYFEGRTLELVIKTLFPVFTCKTAVTGDIIIRGILDPENGSKTWAECL